MACEQEYQALTQASMALAAAVQSYDQAALALQQLAAVVAANAEAVSAAQTAYDNCIAIHGNNHGGMRAAEPVSVKDETREVVKHSRRLVRQSAEVLEGSADMCEVCDNLKSALSL